MDIVWQVDASDISRLRRFVAAHEDNAFVRHRIETNVENPPASIDLDRFWKVSVGCLLSSQQRSGPNSSVSRFLATEPFPLRYDVYRQQDDHVAAGKTVLEGAGGIRFTNRIAEHLAKNYAALEQGLWQQTQSVLRTLIEYDSPEVEREAAAFVRANFVGFGPKQSRNLLQGLGVTRYEIPLDSRVIRWLNEFGFPVQLSAGSLSDSEYYNFVSDGVQALCRQSELLPCVLDAAIFSSYDDGQWTDENIVW